MLSIAALLKLLYPPRPPHFEMKMTETACTSSTEKESKFYGPFLSCLTLVSSFIPILLIVLCCFIFFFFLPSFTINLLAFLFPLLTTTLLFLLALFTLSAKLVPLGGINQKPGQTNMGFLRLINRVDDNDEVGNFEELETYKILFRACELHAGESGAEEFNEPPVDKFLVYSGGGCCNGDTVFDSWEIKSSENSSVESSNEDVEEERAVDQCLHEQKVQAQEVNTASLESKRVDQQQEGLKSRTESNSSDSKIINKDEKFVEEDEDNNSGRMGLKNFWPTAKKQRDWRRTLACKLHEERQQEDADDGEGMDMLWEKYEVESSQDRNEMKRRMKNKGHAHVEGHEDEEKDSVEVSEELCCLQALKFSAGKMNNLGLVRPNLVKISRAIKGMGWLHQVSRQKSKKGCVLNQFGARQVSFI